LQAPPIWYNAADKATHNVATVRKIHWRPNDLSHPEWGLTAAHLKKHFFGPGKYALREIDSAGTPEKWVGFLGDLAGRPVTITTSNGMLDVIGTFPKADGLGTFKLGIRLNPRSDLTFDLITVLTKQ
jgi:hypothetical protein